MKSVLTVAAAIAVLSVAACNRTQQETESAATTPAPAPPLPSNAVAEANAANQPALPAAGTAAGFVTRAALSDMYEIESSRLALQRSQNNAVKRYAQMMIDAHTATTREVQGIVSAENLTVTPPPSLDRARSDLIADLRGASVEDFDDRYIDQQTAAHEEALRLMRDYAGAGDNATLRAFATRTAPTIEQHLTMVRALDSGEADDTSGANAPAAAAPAAPPTAAPATPAPARAPAR